ncbi:hypothetical protein OCOL_001812 [Ordospora colligata]
MKDNNELVKIAMEFISEYKKHTDDKKLSFIKEVDNDLLIHILDPRSINQTDSDDLKEDILKYIFQDESKAKEIVNSIDDTRQLMNLVERFAKNKTGTIKKICSLPTEKEQEGSMIPLIQEFSAFLNAIELSDEKKLIEMSETELTNTIKQTGKFKMVVEVFIKEIIEGIDKIIANEKEESMKQLKNLDALKKRIRTLLYEIFANVLSKSNSRHKQMIVLKTIEDSIRMIKEYRESVDEVFAKILEKIYDKKPNNTKAVKNTFIAIVYMYSSNGYAIDTKDKNLDVVLNKILEKIDGKRLKLILKSVLEQEKNQIYENIEKVSISDNMSVDNAANTLMNDMDYITAAIALVNMKCSRAAKILKHIRSYPLKGNLYNAVLLSCMSASHAAKILECMYDISAAKILECMKDAYSAAKILGYMKDVNNKFDIWSAAQILGWMKDANNAAQILGCMNANNDEFDINSVAKILKCMYYIDAAKILQCMKNAYSAAEILECIKDKKAAEILGCMKDVNNKFDINSVAKILGCMKDANNAAEILGWMKDANNKFDINSVAKILECMDDMSAAEILKCMKDSEGNFNAECVAKILQRMSTRDASFILKCMYDAAKILECMKDAYRAAEILKCMNTNYDEFDINSAAEILKCMHAWNAAKILECMKDANNAAKILECMKDANNKFDINSVAKILECMDDNVRNNIQKCVNDIRIAKEQLEESKDDTKSKKRLQGDVDQLNKKYEAVENVLNTTSNPKGKKIKLEISMIFVVVVMMIVEVLMSVISVMNALMNEHGINVVINKMIMTIVSVMVMLSVIVYVMSKNRSVLYDVVMIGGSVCVALMKVCMLVYERMGLSVNDYVNVMNKVMIGMSVVMIIASAVVVINVIDHMINLKKTKNLNESESMNSVMNNNNNAMNENGYDTSNEVSRMTKSVIVVLSVCIMMLTGCMMQSVNVNVYGSMNENIDKRFNMSNDKRVNINDVIIGKRMMIRE